MHVKFKRSSLGDYGRVARGEIKDVPPAVAKSLIEKGTAEKAEGDPAKAARAAAVARVRKATGKNIAGARIRTKKPAPKASA